MMDISYLFEEVCGSEIGLCPLITHGLRRMRQLQPGDCNIQLF